jgi:hypothetical protein
VPASSVVGIPSTKDPGWFIDHLVPLEIGGLNLAEGCVLRTDVIVRYAAPKAQKLGGAAKRSLISPPYGNRRAFLPLSGSKGAVASAMGSASGQSGAVDRHDDDHAGLIALPEGEPAVQGGRHRPGPAGG